MIWIDSINQLNNDTMKNFENLINNLESTWNILTIKLLTIGNQSVPKIAIGNSGYIGLSATNHGMGDLAIVLLKRNLNDDTASNCVAFCKLNPISKNCVIKKYNSLYNRGVSIINKAINTAIANNDEI